MMIKSDKKLKNLQSLLSNDDDFLIAEAIKMLREEEPFEGAISLLADHYDRTASHAVHRAIEDFMNDMKDPSVQPEVIVEIKKKRKSPTLTMLVSSCWQSGMDYSGYAFDFADVFLNSDVPTSVECFTVLEESIPQMEDKEKEQLAMLIRERKPEDGTRKSLAEDLLSMIVLHPYSPSLPRERGGRKG